MNLPKEQIEWLEDGTVSYPTVELQYMTVKDDGTRCLHMEFTEYLSATDYSKEKPVDVISKLFHEVVEFILKNIYGAVPNQDFLKYYNLIMPDTDKMRVLKSCYGILLLLRNCVEHHITTQKFEGIYEYTQGGKKFFVRLPEKGIALLDEIFKTLINRDCGVATQKHYDDFLACRYLVLFSYLKATDNYQNPNAEIYQLKTFPKLKWISRWLILNPVYRILDDGTIAIDTIVKKSFEGESFDFLIEVNNKQYIIPLEILHNQSVRSSKLIGWELLADYTHGISIKEHIGIG